MITITIKRTIFTFLLLIFTFGLNGCGEHEDPGEVTPEPVPQTEIEARQTSQYKAKKRSLDIVSDTGETTQILFGDLHVHTTFSNDAFAASLPILGGEGSRPPADACDFARFCSQLDFWSINDHAEGLTPRRWEEMQTSIRQCNKVAGQSNTRDLVSYLGYEWTQEGKTPKTHYGHKNVIFKNTADSEVPARPVASKNPHEHKYNPDIKLWQDLLIRAGTNLAVSPKTRERIRDFSTFLQEIHNVKICPKGVNSRELPTNCLEVARTPRILFKKLNEWGYETLVVPHGTTWGIYTPPGSSWDKQLNKTQHDPSLQKLIEVYSGHGNSEEYGNFRSVKYDKNGNKYCPKPTENHLPCCWRAGQIIRSRCDNPESTECQKKVNRARQNYLKWGTSGHMSVPGTTPEDWKDCGICTDCFNPTFKLRPKNSAQYILALSNFDENKNPMRFTLGFIASSDNHKARPGTGYKEFDRLDMSEAGGIQSKALADLAYPRMKPGPEKPLATSYTPSDFPNARRVGEQERQSSLFMTGGLAAVHAKNRSRDSIWKAIQNRHVYGTSGDRILLWFNLLDGGGNEPMGSQVSTDDTPRFRVRAIGTYKQKDGCPNFARNALGEKRVKSLCGGECYNPGNERHDLKRIEVVRIRPQTSPDEPIGKLIEDPWKTFECPENSSSCVVEFEDRQFLKADRETVYYVRAIQKPTPAVNAGGLRCKYNDEGKCVKINPCYGDYRTDPGNDCLAPNQERAWSSPIYVKPSE